MNIARAALTRRAFSALVVGTAPAVSLLPGSSELKDARHGQFVRDLVRSWDGQLMALDMEDIRLVLDGAQSPSLGAGVAAGVDRASRAANQALGQAGRRGLHALIITVLPKGEVRLVDYRDAFNTIRAQLDPAATIIGGGCHDEQLAPGSARVSLFIG